MYSKLTTEVKNANGRSYYAVRVDTMGSRIRALREAQGMSQEALGRLCNVTRGSVSQWEIGITANIRLQTFLTLCDVLHTDPHFLIYGTSRRAGKPIQAGGASA